MLKLEHCFFQVRKTVFLLNIVITAKLFKPLHEWKWGQLELLKSSQLVRVAWFLALCRGASKELGQFIEELIESVLNALLESLV